MVRAGIHELYLFFHKRGYDIFFFEGPGQGETLLRGNLKMTPRWEECTSAVLDYFDLNNVTLIGISLGGYLALRAAAYDSAIKEMKDTYDEKKKNAERISQKIQSENGVANAVRLIEKAM